MTISFRTINYDTLRQALGGTLSGTQTAPPGYERNAVCLLLFERAETVLLAIQKADSEGYPWRDQVALPGGRIDSSDHDARDAALRELHEELAVDRSGVDVLGTLGHFQTIGSNDLEVIVGRWTRPSKLRMDPKEIQRVLELSLPDLIDRHVELGFHLQAASAIGDALVYPLPDARIWGVTARILHDFLDLVRGHNVLVRRSS